MPQVHLISKTGDGWFITADNVTLPVAQRIKKNLGRGRWPRYIVPVEDGCPATGQLPARYYDEGDNLIVA